MSLPEAAASLGRDETTLLRQIKRGSLRATRIGHFWVIEEGEVERYRREHLGKSHGPSKKKRRT